ncbi:sigma-70 family RNA polymerase sigma factor [Chitinophaga sancti]|uniref:RNA polymerase sigma factor n=1 Tax=Chitinophaga sancti TaxID=1004 RepID=UPI002A749D1A|nr:sigma-70 family RNA polymerase sigma factor [Chitinophaga sancti]WPQ60414.1 sigma-70 family RNA polymerase sigma factor [Chitinophaga sancti]
MTHIEEQEYIRRIQDGDSKAYAFLVDKYKNMAYTISLKMIQDPAGAEDAAQESFIKAYEAIRSFKGGAKFSTWLYTIVYRTCLAHIKQRKAIPVSKQSPDEYYNRFDDQPHKLEKMQQEEKSKYITRAINELPANEAILITLYYMNENSIKEINEITGQSTANIKVQLFRARKKLEQKLSGLI